VETIGFFSLSWGKTCCLVHDREREREDEGEREVERTTIGLGRGRRHGGGVDGEIEALRPR
jgi:hypothetical protein